VAEPEELERLILAAETSLRAEDALLLLDETRALALLVASPPESVPLVVKRIVARAGAEGRKDLEPRVRAAALRGTAWLDAPEKAFEELTPLSRGAAVP
jgi:hypothetical protein